MFVLKTQKSMAGLASNDGLFEITGKSLSVIPKLEIEENDSFNGKAGIIISDYIGGGNVIIGVYSTYNAAKNALTKIYTAIASGSVGMIVPEDENM